MKSIIADIIINNKISALEISTKLEELSEKVQNDLISEMGEYGMSIPTFFIESINFPDEDFEKINKILEDKAEFEIMGDQRYATKRSFDVYEGAAKNQGGVAGAMLAGGVALGAGVNMLNSMNQTMATPNTEKTVICPSCNTTVPKEYKFCNNCGTSLEIKRKKCIKCNAENAIGAKFCNNCGANLQIKICECGYQLDPGAKFCPECGNKVI
ncbi:double zinc ribbon domain-containing protein [Anaeromicropila herbilytica]|uniref:double zinc ribbon domain-containing protein n=1 Tax=Anaeromicropila herbilytica TaxID=2785025 RepID=UPI002ED4C92D